jgi:hypothetical protein
MTETQEHLYAAVELAYSEGQWQQALAQGEQLLQQIGTQNPTLRVRLELLLGHTQLYGFANAAAAAQHYTTVQQLQPEPILLDIAQQGLEQCRQLQGASTSSPEGSPAPEEPLPIEEEVAAAAPPATDPFGAIPAEAPSAAGGATTAAMPWMVDLGGQDPAAGAPATLEALATNPFLQAAAAGVEAGTAASFPPGPAVAAVAEPPLTLEKRSALAVREPEPPAAVVEPEVPAEPLAVDVVDEPELIEVRQADPSTAESIEVVPLEESPPEEAPAPAAMAAGPEFSPEEEEFLARGLLRVVLA